jgi:hypothetical protein
MGTVTVFVQYLLQYLFVYTGSGSNPDGAADRVVELRGAEASVQE